MASVGSGCDDMPPYVSIQNFTDDWGYELVSLKKNQHNRYLYSESIKPLYNTQDSKFIIIFLRIKKNNFILCNFLVRTLQYF